MRAVGRAVLLSVIAGVGACALPEPALLTDVRSDWTHREVHQCVTEQLVDRGFRVLETRRDDGVIKARRTFPQEDSFGSNRESYDDVDVLIFERTSGEISIQLHADSFRMSGERMGPTPALKELPAQLAEACSSLLSRVVYEAAPVV